jgi:hypothetical protein
MNDQELDELLNAWKTPTPRAAFLKDVRDRVRVEKPRTARPPLFTHWRLMGAMAAVLVVAVLLTNLRAFSQKVTPPFTIDSEIRYYNALNQPRVAPPGSQTSRMYIPPMPSDAQLVMTSYNDAGTEVILSWAFPNHALKTLFGKILLTFSNTTEGFKRHFLLDPDPDADAFAQVYTDGITEGRVIGRRDELLSTGCKTSHGNARVTGQETVLNYTTTVVEEESYMSKVTLWMAPELSCFALRATLHAQQPDGSWKLAIEKQAVSVTVNR